MTESSDREVLAVLGELASFIPHKSFTKVQARCIPNIVQRNDHVIVAAPTGSGKTLLMEVAIVKLFQEHLLQCKKCNASQQAKFLLRSESPHKVQKSKRREAFDAVLQNNNHQMSQVTESILDKNYSSNNTTNNVSHECNTQVNDNQTNMKAVYICPMKALANEKYTSWTEMFPTLSVVIETGDQDMSYAQEYWNDEERLERISDADIIITTPERWDSITRRWKENQVFAIVNTIGLLLLDEVHTIHEERGAALEAVVSRMKVIINEVNQTSRISTLNNSISSGSNDNCNTNTNDSIIKNAVLQTRFIAISGTLPNVDDFAEWLHVPTDCVFTFTQLDRPVPLSIKVLPFRSNSNNPYAFDRFISFKLTSLIKEYSDGRPTLIFCASRRDAVTSAQRITTEIETTTEHKVQAKQEQPHQLTSPFVHSMSTQHLIQSVKDKELRHTLSVGVGFHHAALTLEDRQCVESMYRNGQIAVLCATTTLSLGVNLPAHLVMIKGTTFFNRGVRSELPLSEVAQMCGRAGRPGLDTHGMALILTTTQAAATYQPLALNSASTNNCNFQFNKCQNSNNTNIGQLEVAGIATTAESQLHRHMIEHVNAEIALRTIHNFESAIAWVETTFFWTRLAKCPAYYGLKFTSETEAAAFRPLLFVQKLMERVLLALANAGCITLSHFQEAEPLELRSSSSSFELSKTSTCTPNDLHVINDSKSYTPSVQIDRVALIESTRLGRAMSRLYILFETVCLFNSELYTKSNKINNKNNNIINNDVNGNKCETSTECTDVKDNMANEEESINDDNIDDVNICETVSHINNANTEDTGKDSKICVSMWGLQISRVSLPQVLEVLSKCEEFAEVRLRQGDKGPLNEINKLVRFPIHGARRGGREVREDWHKVYLIIQCQLSQIAINDMSLRNDATRAWTLIPRLARFLHLFVSYMNITVSYINSNTSNEKNNKNFANIDRSIGGISEKMAKEDTFSLFVQTHLLQRCVQRRVWHDGLVLRQLCSVTDAVAKALMESKVRTFADIRAIDPHKLEILCGKPPPFGTVVCNEVLSLPHCINITVSRVNAKNEGESATWQNNKCISQIDNSRPGKDRNENNVYNMPKGKANRRVPLTHLMLQQRRSIQYCIRLEFKITRHNNNIINNNHITGEPKTKNKLARVEQTHNVLLVVGDMLDDRIVLRREFALPATQTDAKSTNANKTISKYTSNSFEEIQTLSDNDNNNGVDSSIYSVEYTFTLYQKQMINSKRVESEQEESEEEQKNAESEAETNALSRLSAYVLTEHIVGNDMMVRLSECTLNKKLNNTSHDKSNTNITGSDNNMHKNKVECSAFDAFCDDLRMIEKNASKKISKQNNIKQLEKCTSTKNGMANNAEAETNSVDIIKKGTENVTVVSGKELCSKQNNTLAVSSSAATIQREAVLPIPAVITMPKMMTEDARIEDDETEDDVIDDNDISNSCINNNVQIEECETSNLAAGEECNVNISNSSEAEAAFAKNFTKERQENKIPEKNNLQEKLNKWEEQKPLQYVQERSTVQAGKSNQCINKRISEMTSNGRCDSGVIKNTIQLPPCPPSPEPVCCTRDDVRKETTLTNLNVDVNRNSSNVFGQNGTSYGPGNMLPGIRCKIEGQHPLVANRMHIPQVQLSEPVPRHRFHFGVNDKPLTPSHKLNYCDSYYETTHANSYLPSRQCYPQRAHQKLASPSLLIPVNYNNRVERYSVAHESQPHYNYNVGAANENNITHIYDNLQSENYIDNNNNYKYNSNDTDVCKNLYATRTTSNEINTPHRQQQPWAEEFMRSCQSNTSHVTSPILYERHDISNIQPHYGDHPHHEYVQHYSSDNYYRDCVHRHTPNIPYNNSNIQYHNPKEQEEQQGQQQNLQRLSSLSATPAAWGRRPRKNKVTRD